MAEVNAGLYRRIIEQAFKSCFSEAALRRGQTEFIFERSELEQIVGAVRGAQDRAKNTSDTIYYYRYRQKLPVSIAQHAPDDHEWIIRDLGKRAETTRYAFCLVKALRIEYDPAIIPVKMLDATPAMISRYADHDEQALLASVRYNRLLDAFLEMPCYSLQSHMRRSMHPSDGVSGIQVDVDEMYVAVDGHGIQYAVPVEAKVGTENVGRVQIEKNALLAIASGPKVLSGRLESNIRKAAELLRRRHIVMFEFEFLANGDLQVVRQAQYYLVPSDYSEYESLPESLRTQRLILTDAEIGSSFNEAK